MTTQLRAAKELRVLLWLFSTILTFQSFSAGAADGEAVKVIFIGDSITAGVCDGVRFTYRDPLLTSLNENGYLVDAIGHRTSAEFPGECFTFADGEHASYPGAWVHDLVPDIQLALAELESPDIAIIMGGVNDLNLGESASQIVLELENLLNEVWAKNPSAMIFLSNVLDNTSWGPNVPELNAAIQARFNGMQNVTLMDLNSVFILGTHDTDGLHPSSVGAQVLADEIERVLVGSGLLPSAEVIMPSVDSTSSSSGGSLTPWFLVLLFAYLCIGVGGKAAFGYRAAKHQ